MDKQSKAVPSKAFRENTCRTCLSRIFAPNTVQIFSDAEFYKGRPLHQVFKELTNTLIETNDSLPKNICLKCARKLKQSVSFKRNIEEANKTLTCNLRKAEWAHFGKVSKKIPSDFAVVLDRFCEGMREIVDEEEISNIGENVILITDENNTDTNILPIVENATTPIINNSKPTQVIPKANSDQTKIITTNKSKFICNTPSNNQNLKRVMKPIINNGNQNAPPNNKIQKIQQPVEAIFSGREFIEEILKNQKPAQPITVDLKKTITYSKKDETNTNNSNTEEVYDTIIIIQDEEAECITPNETIDTPIAERHVRRDSLEEEIARIEKECNEAMPLNIFTPDEDKPMACYKCDKRFTNAGILQRHLLYHSLDLIPCGDDIQKENQTKQAQPKPLNPPLSTVSNVVAPKPKENSQNAEKTNAEKITNTKVQAKVVENERKKIEPVIPVISFITQTCQYCQEEIHEYGMRRHIRLKHKAEVARRKRVYYVCPICGKTGRTEDVLRNHLKSHEENYKCDHCNKGFSKETILRDHLQDVHGIRKTSVCYICGKLISVSCMKGHIESHTMTKSIKCTVEGCDALLKYKSSLQHHLERIHGTEMIHMCEYCGKVFPARSSLLGHIRSHSTLLPFKCEVCERSFRTPSYLKKHFEGLHTGEKKYKCPVCPQVFTYKHSIRKHCGRYHPEHPLAKKPKATRNYVSNPAQKKNFSCHLCKRQFAYEFNLKKHNRTFHPSLYYTQKISQQNNILPAEN